MASYKLTDIFFVYQFLRRLTMPFNKWNAFESEVIDKEGNIIVKPDERSDDQDKSFGAADLMILRIKRLLAKVPGGKSQIANYAAALMLLKEYQNPEDTLLGKNDEFISTYRKYLKEVVGLIDEDAPTNTMGSGAIQGYDPVMNMTKKRKLTKRFKKHIMEGQS